MLTRKRAEALALAEGEDVSEGSKVWFRLATEIAPREIAKLVQLYRMMPKASPTKLTLL